MGPRSQSTCGQTQPSLSPQTVSSQTGLINGSKRTWRGQGMRSQHKNRDFLKPLSKAESDRLQKRYDDYMVKLKETINGTSKTGHQRTIGERETLCQRKNRMHSDRIPSGRERRDHRLQAETIGSWQH